MPCLGGSYMCVIQSGAYKCVTKRVPAGGHEKSLAMNQGLVSYKCAGVYFCHQLFFFVGGSGNESLLLTSNCSRDSVKVCIYIIVTLFMFVCCWGFTS